MINYYYIILSLILSMLLSDEKIEPQSSPYQGNWPYYPAKDSLKNIINIDNILCPNNLGCECVSNKDCNSNYCIKLPKGQYCVPSAGSQMPRFVFQDQFGDLVDIYDFYNSGKYILLEISASWCGVCHELASWITHDELNITKKSFWKDEYNQIKEMIKNEEIYLIHVQFQDEFRDNSSIETIEQWYATYPDDRIVILGDYNRELHTLLKPTGLPVICILNDKLEFVQYSNRGFHEAFDKLISIYKE